MFYSSVCKQTVEKFAFGMSSQRNVWQVKDLAKKYVPYSTLSTPSMHIVKWYLLYARAYCNLNRGISIRAPYLSYLPTHSAAEASKAFPDHCLGACPTDPAPRVEPNLSLIGMAMTPPLPANGFLLPVQMTSSVGRKTVRHQSCCFLLD